MKNLLALLLLCTFAFSSSVNAQVTGVQNVPGAYPDLAAAFAALNTQGVGAGGATINVTTPQTCPLRISIRLSHFERITFIHQYIDYQWKW